MNQETNVQEKEARVRQPWTAQRVGDILLNNALLIIMAIAVVYIAIKNPNFIKPASLINILSQTAAYLPAALGIGGCIVLTGTALSAGRAVGITACISASLLQNAANMANKMWPQLGQCPEAYLRGDVHHPEPPGQCHPRPGGHHPHAAV